MLGVRIAKGNVTAPPITWFSLDLAERALRAVPFETQPDMQFTVRLARAAGPAHNLQTAAAPGTAMESANCAPAECWGPPSLDIMVLPPSKEPAGGSNMATADIQQ